MEQKIGCTKPNCDCIEIAEKKNGGMPVKSYPCLHHGFDSGEIKSKSVVTQSYTFSPSELPVGSIVEYNCCNQTTPDWEYSTLDWQDLRSLYDDAIYFNAYHRPIPLTPEVMERLPQFQEGMVGWYYHDTGKFRIKIKPETKQLMIDGTGVNYTEYVHLLQNFFRALTNTDLIIKQA